MSYCVFDVANMGKGVNARCAFFVWAHCAQHRRSPPSWCGSIIRKILGNVNVSFCKFFILRNFTFGGVVDGTGALSHFLRNVNNYLGVCARIYIWCRWGRRGGRVTYFEQCQQIICARYNCLRLQRRGHVARRFAHNFCAIRRKMRFKGGCDTFWLHRVYLYATHEKRLQGHLKREKIKYEGFTRVYTILCIFILTRGRVVVIRHYIETTHKTTLLR